MIYYHGSNEIIRIIDFNKSNLRTDFGKGFYLGSRLKEARKWAIGKAGYYGIATIMKYIIKDGILHDTCVNPLIFNLPNIDWLNFVKENRRKSVSGETKSEPRHSYDVVFGPIANDRVNRVIAKYCENKINAIDALSLIRTIPNVFQMSIHTELALTYIESITYQQLLANGKWSKWILLM